MIARLLNAVAGLPARWRGGGRLPTSALTDADAIAVVTPARPARPYLTAALRAAAAPVASAARSQLEEVGVGVPVQPHQCDPCGQVVTSISRDQAAAFERDGIIPCPCGGILRPVGGQPAPSAAVEQGDDFVDPAAPVGDVPPTIVAPPTGMEAWRENVRYLPGVAEVIDDLLAGETR